MAPNSELTTGLNEPQERAVRHPGGPLLVLAGAGSGKTRVLTSRIAWLISGQQVRPEEIVAFTFTNKAAAEMRERIAALVGSTQGMWVGTFHSTGVRILRRFGPEIGIPRNFSIYDYDDQVSVVKEILREMGLGADREATPKKILGRISDAKEAGVSPEELAREARGPLDRRAGQVYGLYEAALARASALDFDDLIVRTLALLRQRPDIEESLSRRFRHVLVDEYQDTNTAQVELVRRLGGVHRNIFVVGDDDQSIYGWRGADPTNILRFEQAFPDAQVVRLEQNYRSTMTILKAANAVIRHNRNRKGKELWSEREPGTLIEWVETADEEAEAELVRGRIARGIEAGLTTGDFAVLYRTNAQSRALEGALRRSGTPYQLVGGVAFYQRREVKDLLAFLRLLLHPEDDLAFRRICNVPPRGMGATFLEKLDQAARETGLPLQSALFQWADEGRLTGARNAGALQLVHLLRDLRKLTGEDITLVAEELIERLEYRKYLAQSEPDTAEERVANVNEFVGGAAAFALRAEDPSLEGFLAEAALIADVDRMAEGGERVTLMTAHAAKGLEFPVVFVVGLEEGLFPLTSFSTEPSHLEEERRLFYVALTRAEDQLVLTSTRFRRRYDLSGASMPSRFLAEIPGELLRGAPAPSRGTLPTERPRLQSAAPPAAAEPAGTSWVGRFLNHAQFGPGRVVEQEGKGSQAKLTVEFAGGVRRKILARYVEEDF